jgi:hypothetical protein
MSSVAPARRIAHGNGQMRAQSISIQVSNRTRCNAGCRFCISRTTPGAADQQTTSDIRTCSEGRLRVGLNYAKQLGATHAILTSRADPTQEDGKYLSYLVRWSREYLPLVDIHTNGYFLLPGKPQENLLPMLVDAGLTMVTFSIASFDDIENRNLMLLKENIARMIPIARDLGLLVRCSLVVNSSGVRNFDSVMNYIMAAGGLGAQMVVVREVWVPEVYGNFNKGVFDWNRTHQVGIAPIQDQFESVADIPNNKWGLRRRTPLPWGTPVFTVSGVFDDREHGVNVTFARCDEAADGDVLKSIVHRPDGHGYRNWDDRGDILY